MLDGINYVTSIQVVQRLAPLRYVHSYAAHGRIDMLFVKLLTRGTFNSSLKTRSRAVFHPPRPSVANMRSFPRRFPQRASGKRYIRFAGLIRDKCLRKFSTGKHFPTGGEQPTHRSRSLIFHEAVPPLCGGGDDTRGIYSYKFLTDADP